MDQLPTDQQESLRKTNTERLRLMAARIGDIDEDHGSDGPDRQGSEGQIG